MPFNVGPIELVVILVMLLGLVVVVVLIVRALTMGTRRRICPVCGSPVERGRTTCATCQHDFAAAHRS